MPSHSRTTDPAEPVPRRWRLVLGVLVRLPQAGLSRLFGRVADVPVPRGLRRPLFRAVARALGIDLAEAAQPPEAHRTLNAFFVRRLRPDARVWPDDEAVGGSPVDGVLGPFGTVHRGRALQAKGLDYSIPELLADRGAGEGFEGGSFLTLYLAPRHYHRIHAPMRGRVREARHVPGRLLPVNPWARRSIADLLPRNERLVCHLERSGGRIAVVAVGAFNVGRISAAFDPSWNRGKGGGRAVTNHRRTRSAERRRYDPPVEVDRGEELMAFHLGSTVILLWEEGAAALDPDLREGDEVRLGAPVMAPAFRTG